jgi:hypothetical protein
MSISQYLVELSALQQSVKLANPDMMEPIKNENRKSKKINNLSYK